ncbi:MAG: AraC family transcriptional regulator [Burkholderiaceae bacterium]
MSSLPYFDLADYLPAVPGSTEAWSDLPWDGGSHTTAYGLSASASRSYYPEQTPLLMGDSLHRMYLSVWLRDGVQVGAGSRAIQINRHDVATFLNTDDPILAHFGGDNHHVVLTLRPELLHELATAQAEPFLAGLRRAGRVTTGAGHARVLRAAHELEAVLLDAGSSALLREAKSLELLALMLQTGSAEARPDMPTGRQLARLRQARELLLQDLTRPPTIDELARACGLNTFALKQGFKRLFGLSVHTLYQQERMRHAWHLIESGQAQAAEAGRLVGYRNASHFSDAFRKAFGVLPGQLKRRTAVAFRR